MTIPNALFQSSLTTLKLRARGKVRDIYDIDDQYMLIVATDRLSAFDVVLPDPIPGKGRVLTAVSNFWFKKMQHIIPNHLVDCSLEQFIIDSTEQSQVQGRAVVVKRFHPLPVEAIVRGYLIGSGWKDYQQTGMVCGIELPKGLQQAEQLAEPLFTPSTKAAVDQHDQNVSYDEVVNLIGSELAAKVRDVSLELYQAAADYAKERGIIIADTKFEFGVNDEGDLFLIDELLTPDSSRFWPVDQYQIGISPPSFDKQYIRDYLEQMGWNKVAPGPHLPLEVTEYCAAKYREAELRLTQ